MTIPLDNGTRELLKRRKHWLATLWKIERTDSTVFRFTSNTQEITFENELYTPVDSVQVSARRKEADLAIENLEMIGPITSNLITHEDLRSGLFNEAEITESWIDYRFPWMPAITTAKYWITEVKYSAERWEAKVEGLTRWIIPRVGRMYTRECDNDLGDAVCRVDVVGLSEAGSILSVTGGSLNNRSLFEASGLTESADFFTHGRLTWLTGPNTAKTSVVKLHSTPAAVQTLELQLPTDFNISVLDTFNVQPGCDKLRDTCINKFNIIENFGGFPFIPGSDAMLETPKAK